MQKNIKDCYFYIFLWAEIFQSEVTPKAQDGEEL